MVKFLKICLRANGYISMDLKQVVAAKPVAPVSGMGHFGDACVVADRPKGPFNLSESGLMTREESI